MNTIPLDKSDGVRCNIYTQIPISQRAEHISTKPNLSSKQFLSSYTIASAQNQIYYIYLFIYLEDLLDLLDGPCFQIDQ